MKVWPPVSFIIFSVTIILVGALPALKLPCPGNGIIEAAKDLTVVSVEAKLVSMKDVFTFSECGVPMVASKFTYAVDMLLANEGTATSQGNVLVKFYNDNAGVVLDELGQPVSFPTPTRFVFVEIPAKSSKHWQAVLSFEDLPLEPQAEPHRV